MQYLLMIHPGESVMEDGIPDQMIEMVTAVEEFDRDLTRSGQNIGSIRLGPWSTASTLRVRGGEILIAEGPFEEAKEQIGGLYII